MVFTGHRAWGRKGLWFIKSGRYRLQPSIQSSIKVHHVEGNGYLFTVGFLKKMICCRVQAPLRVLDVSEGCCAKVSPNATPTGGFASSSWFLCWGLWYSASFLFQKQRNIGPLRSPYLSCCSNIVFFENGMCSFYWLSLCLLACLYVCTAVYEHA